VVIPPARLSTSNITASVFRYDWTILAIALKMTFAPDEYSG